MAKKVENDMEAGAYMGADRDNFQCYGPSTGYLK